MEIKSICNEDLWEAVSDANRFYGDNIKLRDNRPAVGGVRFILAVGDPNGPGAKVSGKNFGKPRHGSNVCWHGHRDLFAAVLLANPDAQIRSAVAAYDGAQSFLDRFPRTGRENIGSPMYPISHWDACDCENGHTDGPLVTLLRTALVAI